MPNSQALQVFYGVLPVVAAILLAHWNNNKRLEELSKRIDDLNASLSARITDLKSSTEQRFNRIDDRLDKIESSSRLVR